MNSRTGNISWDNGSDKGSYSSCVVLVEGSRLLSHLLDLLVERVDDLPVLLRHLEDEAWELQFPQDRRYEVEELLHEADFASRAQVGSALSVRYADERGLMLRDLFAFGDRWLEKAAAAPLSVAIGSLLPSETRIVGVQLSLDPHLLRLQLPPGTVTQLEGKLAPRQQPLLKARVTENPNGILVGELHDFVHNRRELGYKPVRLALPIGSPLNFVRVDVDNREDAVYLHLSNELTDRLLAAIVQAPLPDKLKQGASETAEAEEWPMHVEDEAGLFVPEVLDFLLRCRRNPKFGNAAVALCLPGVESDRSRICRVSVERDGSICWLHLDMDASIECTEALGGDVSPRVGVVVPRNSSEEQTYAVVSCRDVEDLIREPRELLRRIRKAVCRWGLQTEHGRETIRRTPDFNVGDLDAHLTTELREMLAQEGVHDLRIDLFHDQQSDWEFDDSLAVAPPERHDRPGHR